ncbi:response regulator transcription factor [Phycicoccus sp. CMS6Z-2]|nr:response regulator transcription factor [Phycicoccus flavus]
MILESEDDLVVVGEAGDGDAAVAVVRDVRPDVVLMDIRMPGRDGLSATEEICADAGLAGVRVLVLTTFELDEYVFEALRLGASGFVLKDLEPADLLTAVRQVASGDAVLSPSVTRRLVEHVGSGDARRPPVEQVRALAALTEREREVVGLVGQGLANDEIAARLFLSPATAKTHVSRAMTKVGARDRAQLVVLAYESGLVRPGWMA